MAHEFAHLCGGLPLDPLPANRGRTAGIAHAPKRSHRLDPAQKQLAVRNALRYFPVRLHPLLQAEFAAELEQYGHIYMYR